MNDHPYGWISLLPPLLAIGLAIVTRRVIVSLLAGVFAGALILAGGNPLVAVGQALETHLWKTLVDEQKLRIFAFTLLMGAMVGVIGRAAGMRGLVELVRPWAHNRRRGQLATWLLGLLIFFDDYANTMLLGSTLRPLCDRLRISREKLAYLVDSTAAPVAGLALVSTWVAGEIGYVQEGLDKLPEQLQWKAFDLFLHSIPYRFYVIWTLLLVPLVAWWGRDLGPMWRAERDCLDRTTAGLPAAEQQLAADPTTPDPALPARWYNAVVPILVTVIAIVWLLYATGRSAVGQQELAEVPTLLEIFGQADAFFSLLWGSLAGLVTAVALVAAQRLLNGRQLLEAAGTGARLMLPALAILWFASALSAMTGDRPLEDRQPADGNAAVNPWPERTDGDEPQPAYPHQEYRLYTATYVGTLLERRLPAPLLPSVVFVLAAAVAFATGTSWGTMGILMPLVIPLTYAVLADAGPVPPDQPVLLAAIGSVLAGAIFGDHCSPISDTTILSSQASGCDHMAHVWTQLPYALLVGGVTILCGTLPLGLGVPVWVLLPLGPMVLALCLWWWGKPVEVAGSG